MPTRHDRLRPWARTRVAPIWEDWERRRGAGGPARACAASRRPSMSIAGSCREEDARQRDHEPGVRRGDRNFAPSMTGAFHLLGTRRFVPLFATQMLGAFN